MCLTMTLVSPERALLLSDGFATSKEGEIVGRSFSKLFRLPSGDWLTVTGTRKGLELAMNLQSQAPAHVLEVLTSIRRWCDKNPGGATFGLVGKNGARLFAGLIWYDSESERWKMQQECFFDHEYPLFLMATGFVEDDALWTSLGHSDIIQERDFEAASERLRALFKYGYGTAPGKIGGTVFEARIGAGNNSPDGGEPWQDFGDAGALYRYERVPTTLADSSHRFAVVNGGGMNAVSSVDTNNRALIDLSQSSLTATSFTVPGLNPGTVDAASGIIIDGLAAVPDSPASSRFAVLAIDSNRRPIIDYTGVNHIGTLPPGRSDPYLRDAKNVAYNRSLISITAGTIIGRGPCADSVDVTGVSNEWTVPTSSLPASCVIDLGAICFTFGWASISAFFVTDPRFLPSAGSIDLSRDNVTWETGKGSWSGQSVDPIVVPLSQPANGARYVRINMTGAPINPAGQTATQISNVRIQAFQGGSVVHADYNIRADGNLGLPLNSRLNAGRPVIDLAEPIHLNKHLGNIANDPGGNRAAWDTAAQKAAAVDSNGNLLLKNIAGAVPTTSSPSTTSTTYSVIPELTQTITTKGNKVLLTFAGSFTAPSTASVLFAFFRDGIQITTDFLKSTTGNDIVSFSFLDTPAAGSHTFDVRWRINGAGSFGSIAAGTARAFQAVELG